MIDIIHNIIDLSLWSPDLSWRPAQETITTAIILFFGILILLEARLIRKAPNQSRRKLLQSYRINSVTLLFNDTLMSLLSVSSLLLLAEKYNQHGLLNDSNFVSKTLTTFIILDLMLYLWHKANHQFECLWQFHKVHHSDQSMNVSTAFRIHFVELVLTTLLKALFIIALGVESTVVACSEALTAWFAMLHHAKLAIPGEKWLKWLFIVPSLHRVHHSAKRSEHDSNYGAILSIWDRVFNTLLEIQPEKIGLYNVNVENFLALLKFGFTTDPIPPAQHAVQTGNIEAMIAEAAYFKAEKRGFKTGWELQDWFDAEQETLNAFH